MKKIMTAAVLVCIMLLCVGCDNASGPASNANIVELADGEYQVAVTLSGGTGRAFVISPTKLTVKNNEFIATIVWSSANYDYMVVDGIKYEAAISDNHSIFEIPISVFDSEIAVIANTVAMSTPHEIEYILLFDSATIVSAENSEVS